MTGRHRKPSPLGPLGPIAAGASLAVLSLLVGTTVAAQAAPVKVTAKAAPLPPVKLPLPLLSVANAAMYLTPIPVSAMTEPTVLTAETVRTAPAPFTVKAAGTSGGLAARAVSAAIAQQGAPYVYGGSAPGGFDCSGLVMWAFKRAGITLPRTAAAQYSAGRPVSVSALQPGDLLMYYRPVDHVVMYVGNGQIVEASQPGSPVHVRPMYLNGFVGARRVI